MAARCRCTCRARSSASGCVKSGEKQTSDVGWTLTEGEERVKREEEGLGADWLADAVKTRPFGRLLSPLDIAHAAAYFASDDSAVITGSVLDLEQFAIGAPGTW